MVHFIGTDKRKQATGIYTQSVMCYSAGIAAYRRRIRRRISLFVVQITCTLIWTKANIISILLSGCSTIQFYLYIFIAFLKINLNIVFLWQILTDMDPFCV